MSGAGEGFAAQQRAVPSKGEAPHFWHGICEGLSIERADVLAYLAQRRANAVVMAEASHEFADMAHDRARQIGVMIDEIAAGLHDGAAFVAAELASAEVVRGQAA